MSTWEKDELKVSLIGNKKVIIKMINTIYRNLKMSEHIEDSESIEMIRKTIHNFQSKKIYRHYLLEYCDSYHKDSLDWEEESNFCMGLTHEEVMGIILILSSAIHRLYRFVIFYQ